MEMIKLYKYAVLSSRGDSMERFENLLRRRAFSQKTVTISRGRYVVEYVEPVAELIENYGKGSVPDGIEIKSKLLILSNKSKMKKKNTYALYRGDNLLSFGTLEQIAKDMNVSVSTILHYGIPACKKRAEKNWHNTRVLIKVEDDKEDENENL